MRKLAFFLILISTFTLNARPSSGFYAHPELEELRIELEDLKHALKTAQIELNLFDERLKKQDHVLASVKGQPQNRDTSSASSILAQVNAIERKVSDFEKTLEKAMADLRILNTATTQALNKIQTLELGLSSHEKRLDEVTKLKGTLTTISKAMSQQPEASLSTKLYRVKAGDSLEKIARTHHTSIETLRKINSLASDKIIIGQELRLPDGPL